MKISVVGLGYVGLPLSLQFARSGLLVLGLDTDPVKVAALNAGESYIRHVESATVEEQLKAKRFGASRDMTRIKEVEAAIICVPTPLTKNREPDISFVLETGRTIAPYLSKQALVVLESTTYPGTTDTDLRAVLEEGSGMKAGIDFHLALSPRAGGSSESRKQYQVNSEGCRRIHSGLPRHCIRGKGNDVEV